MEVAGLTTGVLGLAGLFTSAVDCFEYIQLGRSFNQDFRTCSLQLDCAQLQLSRWGQSINFDDIPPEEAQKAEEVLKQIIELFETNQSAAEKYNDRARRKGQDLATEEDNSGLHKKLKKLSKVKDLPSRVKWALHEQSRFRTLIADIKALIADLIELFPAAQPIQKQLAEAEAKELGNDAAEVAKEDPVLAESLPTYSIHFTGHNDHGMQIGHSSGTINFGK